MTHQQSISKYILSLLFAVAPFYLHPNIGGQGLALPFNSAVWLAALIFIMFTYAVASHSKIVYSHYFLYCLIFPAIMVFSGIATDVPQPVVWLFRQLYICGGALFVFALFQLKLPIKYIEQILYLIVISSLAHSLVGIAQLLHITAFHNWIPLGLTNLPIGIFQQVNVQASYLVTCLVIIIFLISRPSFLSSSLLTKYFFVITFGLAMYVIVSSGSRMGVLALLISVPVILLSRKKQLLRHKNILIWIALISVIASYTGQSGFFRALDKTAQLTESEYSSARQTMYSIAVNLIENKPLFGYGIGSFPRVWAEQTAIFSKEHPEATIPQLTSSHPHNEVLLWMIEGGLVSLSGLLIILLVMCRSLYVCGFSRGGAYFALLLPITLHTQVELPFYISSLHWFLWLFFIFMVFRHKLNTVKFNLSQTAKYIIRLSVLLLGLTAGALLVHAEKAEKEIFNYMYGKGGDIQFALADPYFNAFSEKLMMQTLLYSSIEKNRKTSIPTFITWAEDVIKVNPEMGMFVMLSDAYGFVDDKDNQCRVVKRGLEIYTKNERLLANSANCINISSLPLN